MLLFSQKLMQIDLQKEEEEERETLTRYVKVKGRKV